MDWNPSIEQELQRIPKSHASYNPQEEEYGYRAQQSQSQQNDYSTLYMQEPISQYTPQISSGERLGAFISYLFVWLSGFVFFFLFAEKQKRFVRFHALQSMLFFGGLNIVGVGLFAFIYFINRASYYSFGIPFHMIIAQASIYVLIAHVLIAAGWVVLALLFVTTVAGWIMGMVHALQGRYYKLPFVGDIVERFINRQGLPK